MFSVGPLPGRREGGGARLAGQVEVAVVFEADRPEGLADLEAAHGVGRLGLGGGGDFRECGPHTRPWHWPMPQRVKRLTSLTSRKPSATALRISPAVTHSQRQTSVSSGTLKMAGLGANT